ncbi:MAG: hypothetical protein JEZ02_14285 [Desulfatibacillum sp.]|nr:hypothetical protein [Desulfatibacillum sp.]
MKIIARYAVLLLLCAVSFCHAGGLAIDSLHGRQGGTVSFTVSVDSAPNDVKALIMDIKYDPAALTYAGYKRGPLGDSGYPMMIVNEYQPGIIRVGAVDPMELGIAQGDAGAFLHLTFRITGDRDSPISFGVLKDDLAGWRASPGYLTRDDLTEEPEVEEEETQTESDTQNNSRKQDEADQQDAGQNDSTSGGGGAISSAAAPEQDETGEESTNDPASTVDRASVTSVVAGKGFGRVEDASTPSKDAISPDAERNAPENFVPIKDKIAEINSFRNGNPSVSQPGGMFNKSDSAGSLISRKPRAFPGRGSQSSSTSDDLNRPPVSGMSGISDWMPSLVVTLLVVVLVLVIVLIAVLSAILFMLVLIYRKLRFLEKSGSLVVQGPVFTWSNPGKELHPASREHDAS